MRLPRLSLSDDMERLYLHTPVEGDEDAEGEECLGDPLDAEHLIPDGLLTEYAAILDEIAEAEAGRIAYLAEADYHWARR